MRLKTRQLVILNELEYARAKFRYYKKVKRLDSDMSAACSRAVNILIKMSDRRVKRCLKALKDLSK